MCVKPVWTCRDFTGYQDQNQLSWFLIRFPLKCMYWWLPKTSGQWQKKSPPNHQYSPPKKHGEVRQMFFFVHLWIFAQQMLDYLYVHVWMISYCDHFLECILTHKEKEGNYIYNANYSISWLSHHWYFSWDTAKDDWKLKKLQTFKELVAILKEVWF